jgi:hypothetical protein
MMRATVIAILVFFAGFSACHGQLRDSSRNGLMLGILQNADGNGNLTVTYERSIFDHISGLVTIGSVLPKNGINQIKFTRFHLSLEGRYYFALRRNLPMSGFFVGPYISYSESYAWYADLKKTAFRDYYSTIGIGLGYQQLFWNRFRICGEIMPAYPGKFISEGWDRNGFRRYRDEWPAWRTWFAQFSIGFSF